MGVGCGAWHSLHIGKAHLCAAPSPSLEGLSVRLRLSELLSVLHGGMELYCTVLTLKVSARRDDLQSTSRRRLYVNVYCLRSRFCAERTQLSCVLRYPGSRFSDHTRHSTH
jgi:hypothetical protein